MRQHSPPFHRNQTGKTMPRHQWRTALNAFTVRAVALLGAGTLLAACGAENSQSWPPTSPTPRVSISGTVYEHGPLGQRPLANAPVDVSSRWDYFIPMVVTDANGRYSAKGFGETEYKARVDSPEYYQPCYASAFLRSLDVTIDAHVVSGATLTSTGLPASVPLKDPIVSGRVVERTAQGDRPIPGASVIVDFADYDTIPGPAPFITTLTDSQGHYVVCGTAIGTIRVRATGYDGDARGIDLSRPTAHDFALVRR